MTRSHRSRHRVFHCTLRYLGLILFTFSQLSIILLFEISSVLRLLLQGGDDLIAATTYNQSIIEHANETILHLETRKMEEEQVFSGAHNDASHQGIGAAALVTTTTARATEFTLRSTNATASSSAVPAPIWEAMPLIPKWMKIILPGIEISF